VQVLFAGMMVNTSNTTLKQGPKALNAVGVDLTIYVLRGTMLDNLMNRVTID